VNPSPVAPVPLNVDVIGVPIDYGAGRRGVDMGPSAIRYTGLRAGLEALGHRVTDLGNVEVPPSETLVPGAAPLRYLEPIVAVLERVAARVAATAAMGHVPLVLGGDHSIALGSVTGAARDRRLGLVWLDTHGDFNTAETTPSGNVHGMPLAALCGYGDPRLVTLGGAYGAQAKVAPENVAVVGARDLDDGERRLMREAGIHVFSMEAIDRAGIGEVMRRAIEVAARGTVGIWVSLDLDVMDPMYAPGVGTPHPGGLTFREAHLAVEMLAETGRVAGLDVVEVNPVLDRANVTAALAVELVLSAFGKRIWEAV
jgi:arginase